MAAGTVGYSDTRGGDRDYLGGIARSIGNRIKQLPIWQGKNVPLLQKEQKNKERL